MYNPYGIIKYILILMILLTVSCSTFQGSSPKIIGPDAEPTWQFNHNVIATGRIILSNPIDLSFSIAGNVVDLRVKEGDTIEQGDIIARLDPRLFDQEIVSAEADYEVAKANLSRKLVGPSFLELTEAENDLIAAKAVNPESTAQATIQVAEIDSAQARIEYLDSLPLPEDIALAQAEVDRAKTRLDYTVGLLGRTLLIAPINGTVIAIFIQTHEYASIGQPIVRLSDINDLSAEIWIDELDVAGLSIGDEAKVAFDALPGTTSKAVITSITPSLDISDPHNFIVELELLDIPDGLRWGMTAEVSFNQ